MKEKKIRKSLRYSILDGAFYSAMVGFGESFFSAFAVFLKATSMELALLASLPLALGSAFELLSTKVVNLLKSKKRTVYAGALLQSMMYIPIALVFLIPSFKVRYLIAFVSLYLIAGMLPVPAWTSWMGELVAQKQRGAYFGRRNKIAGLTSFFCLLAAGWILNTLTVRTGNEYLGFVAIFMLALAARIVSFLFLLKMNDDEFRQEDQVDLHLLDFIKEASSTNFGILVILLCAMNFAVYLGAPFFTAYMLYDLKLDYLTFTIISATSIIVKFATMPIWGRAGDRFGAKKVLTLSGFLMPAVPALWLFSRDIWYLILIQIYGGFVWAGFEIASFTFMFDATSRERRASSIAYYNAFNGIAIFAGAMLGGFIVRHNSLFWSKYLLVFLISGAVRYLASFLILPKIQEVRRVEGITYHELFLHVITTMPTMGLMHNIITFSRDKLSLHEKFKKI